ncbi:MFS transporter [Ramlibacter sp. MAHUQ-53]|uniref:MFS transporter n=1 Tax=unclassified Ramlibacter TaxID=2617605 RepID=UPI00363266B4
MNPRTSPGPWLPLFLTLAIQAMVSMALITLPVIAPQVARALRVSPALVGPYVSITYLAAMFSSLLGGIGVRRWGAIRVSQWGLLSCAAGLVLCAVPWLPAMALGAFLIGMGYGPITPASSHILARTTSAQRMSLVFSVKQTGVPMGSVLAGAIVPSLMLATGWQASLVVVAAVCVACAWASERQRPVLDDDPREHVPFQLTTLLSPVRMVLAHRALATMAACSFLFSMVQMSLSTYLVTFLNQDLAYGLVAAGLVLSFAQMGGVAGRIAWGYVADRWLGTFAMLMTLAGLMVACALATAAFTPDTPRWLVIAVLVVFGASGIGWNGVYLAEVARRAPPGQAGVATGGTLAFTFLGVVIGPPVFGALSAGFGAYRAGFLSLVVAASAAAVMLVWSRRRAGA